jgi:hypothetical protein
MRTLLTRQLPPLVVAFCFILATSCNSDKKQDKPAEQKDGIKAEQAPVTTTSDQPANAAPPAAAAFTVGPFTILKLEKQALLDLFRDSNTKKLLIQFSDNGVQFMQAAAFAAKKDNVYDNVVKTLIPASASPWDTTGPKILGNNELSKKQIKTLIGGKIDAAHAVDLYFYPIKNANNQIYYIVSTQLVPFTTTGAGVMLGYPAGGEDTKPSPPAPPCSSGCE